MVDALVLPQIPDARDNGPTTTYMNTTSTAARPLAAFRQQPSSLSYGHIYRDCDHRRSTRFIIILACQKDVVICQTIGTSKITAIQRKRFHCKTTRYNYCGTLKPRINGEDLIRIAIPYLADKEILQNL